MASIEAKGDPVQIGFAYERASKLAQQASVARDEHARVRNLVDEARPPPPPKPMEPSGGSGPTVSPPR